jgi:peptide methionine sulfoxide reductase MsrB
MILLEIAIMNLDLITISNFVRIDAGIKKLFANKPLYTSLCGVRPSLTPCEIITIEVLGESQGYWGTQAIWRYADQHWRHFFPNLPSYKSFSRLCSHTTGIKFALWHLLFPRSTEIHILDGVPIPISD